MSHYGAVMLGGGQSPSETLRELSREIPAVVVSARMLVALDDELGGPEAAVRYCSNRCRMATHRASRAA